MVRTFFQKSPDRTIWFWVIGVSRNVYITLDIRLRLDIPYATYTYTCTMDTVYVFQDLVSYQIGTIIRDGSAEQYFFKLQRG